MKCRDCGMGMAVERTVNASSGTIRIHRCGCGSRWESTEKITARMPSIIATGSTPVARRPHTDVTPLFEDTSSPIRSLLPGIQSNPDPERAHVSPTRRKKTQVDYPPDFEAFWSATVSNRSKGLKFDALRAWGKAGKPDCVAMLAAWNAYRVSLGDGYAKDVSTWINAHGHLEEYSQPEASLPPKARQSRAVMSEWLEKKESFGG